MKNFSLGFLLCLCIVFFIIMSYMLWCPAARRLRDTHITNQMILPYNGFVLKPFNNRSVFPHNIFPFFSMQENQDESINEDKAILPELNE